MGRASTRTLLPLDTFARILGMNPLHFNGVELPNSGIKVCGTPMMQYSWQNADSISREELSEAIAQAESVLSQYLGFKLLPTFEVDERHGWPRAIMPEMWLSSTGNIRGQGSALKADWGHVVAAGVQKRDVIVTNQAIVWSDNDGDTYKETATVTVATSVTDPNEIAVVVPGQSGDPTWEIRPLKVAISGGTATITFRREMAVNPALQERLDARSVDGSDDANFLLNVDVYRVWHDPSQQVHFLWESSGPSLCGCGTSSCTTCFLTGQFGCSVVKDYRLGMMSAAPALWNANTQLFEGSGLAVSRAPDQIRLWYRAGFRDKSAVRPMVDMDSRWARAVTYLAASMLDRQLCSCSVAQTEHWRTDLAFASPEGAGTFNVGRALLDNPIGTTRGAVSAWRLIRTEALGEAAAV
jgi:hypothetical protein